MKSIIVSYLSTNPEWKLVFWDDKSFLFLKNIPKYSGVINKYEYKILSPYTAIFQTQVFSKEILGDPERTKEELKRKAETEPNGYIYRGMDAIAKKLLPGLQ